MKNLLLYSFFILVSGKSDGQTQFGIYTEVRHNVFYYFHGGNGMYSESDLHLGGGATLHRLSGRVKLWHFLSNDLVEK